MTLEKYWQKREFRKTPEPKGKVLKASKNRFVVQEHWASHHHFDFRLEMNGVLKSWAVPKGVPEKKGKRVLAIQTEDHPVCLAPSSKVIVPESEKTIKENPSRVLSYNFQNENTEFKEVENFSRRELNNDALTLYFHQGKPLKRLCCTLNHEIFTPEGKKQAFQLKKNDFIFVLKDTFQKRKKELLLGMLLGDAGLSNHGPYSNTASLYFAHTISQKDYLLTKCNLLGLEFHFKKYPPKTQRIKNYIAHFKPSIRAESKSYPFLYDFYLLCYKNGRKTLTKEWCGQLSEISLAYFYLDDGSLLKDKNKVSIHAIEFSTQGFSKEEQILLKETLEKKFNLKANLYKTDSGSGWRLRISSVKRFFYLISPWISPNIMEYKMGKHCPICGNQIWNFSTLICPNCLLNHLRELNYPSYTQYSKFRYFQKENGFVPKTFQNYFGTWEKAIKLAKENRITRDERRGSRVEEIKNEPMKKGIGVAKIRDIKKSWHPKRKYAYDIQVKENHNFFANRVLVGNSYINFQGEIPRGCYGAGVVRVFDKGTYKLIEKTENKIVFELKGKKLKGEYNLIKFKGRNKNQWLLFKVK
ncbi:hypothetical protein J7J81_02790 [bacterium]|nr:hypothetical protein [bacterium]